MVRSLPRGLRKALYGISLMKMEVINANHNDKDK
jgi:hypothetical protein